MVNPYNIKPFFCFENEVDPYVLPWKDDRDMLVSDTRIYASQFPWHCPPPRPLASCCTSVHGSTLWTNLSLGLRQQDCQLLLPLDSQDNQMPGFLSLPARSGVGRNILQA